MIVQCFAFVWNALIWTCFLINSNQQFCHLQTKESEHKKTNNPENKTELALAFEYNFQLILKAHWSIEGISFFKMSNTGVRETKWMVSKSLYRNSKELLKPCFCVFEFNLFLKCHLFLQSFQCFCHSFFNFMVYLITSFHVL